MPLAVSVDNDTSMKERNMMEERDTIKGKRFCMRLGMVWILFMQLNLCTNSLDNHVKHCPNYQSIDISSPILIAAL